MELMEWEDDLGFAPKPLVEGHDADRVLAAPTGNRLLVEAHPLSHVQVDEAVVVNSRPPEGQVPGHAVRIGRDEPEAPRPQVGNRPGHRPIATKDAFRH